jgi:hypothetical protein
MHAFSFFKFVPSLSLLHHPPLTTEPIEGNTDFSFFCFIFDEARLERLFLFGLESLKGEDPTVVNNSHKHTRSVRRRH